MIEQDEVAWLAELCIKIKNGDESGGGGDSKEHKGEAAHPLTALDECRRLIIGRDLWPALTLCNQIIDVRWFIAHLADLLTHAGPVCCSVSLSLLSLLLSFCVCLRPRPLASWTA